VGRLFTPADALEILQNVPPEDVYMLGMDPAYSPPHAMILANLAVLPPNARPAIMASEGSKRRGQDDATSQTQDIVTRSTLPMTDAVYVSAPVSYRNENIGTSAFAAASCIARTCVLKCPCKRMTPCLHAAKYAARSSCLRPIPSIFVCTKLRP
jgi:hypothetical protein